jgi:hypothetical protein
MERIKSFDASEGITSLSDRSLFTLYLWLMTSALGGGLARDFVININVCSVPRIESVIPLVNINKFLPVLKLSASL